MRTQSFGFLFVFFVLPFAVCYSEAPWGKDYELIAPHSRTCAGNKNGPLEWVSEVLIHFHQNYISEADGPRSHFKPSSSQYTLDAIRKHGFFKGYLLGCDRLMRENNDPWIYPTIVIQPHNLETKWDPVK